jgi:hypothetical protein
MINRRFPEGTETISMALALGEWTVTARAYNNNSAGNAAGRATVMVTQGHTPVVIPMGSSNADLSGITIAAEVLGIVPNPLTLTPVFNPDVIIYTATPTLVTLGSHFYVTATLSDPDAVITMIGSPVSSATINGGPVSSGAEEEFDGLEIGGQRTVSIVVTAQDGFTTKTYIVTAIRTI